MLHVYYITRQQGPIKRKGKWVPSSRLHLPPSPSPSSSGTGSVGGTALSQLSFTFSTERRHRRVLPRVFPCLFLAVHRLPSPFPLIPFFFLLFCLPTRGTGLEAPMCGRSSLHVLGVLPIACRCALPPSSCGSRTFPGTRKENSLGQLRLLDI